MGEYTRFSFYTQIARSLTFQTKKQLFFHFITKRFRHRCFRIATKPHVSVASEWTQSMAKYWSWYSMSITKKTIRWVCTFFVVLQAYLRVLSIRWKSQLTFFRERKNTQFTHFHVSLIASRISFFISMKCSLCQLMPCPVCMAWRSIRRALMNEASRKSISARVVHSKVKSTEAFNQHVVPARGFSTSVSWDCFRFLLFSSFRKKELRTKTLTKQKHMRWILNMWGKFE